MWYPPILSRGVACASKEHAFAGRCIDAVLIISAAKPFTWKQSIKDMLHSQPHRRSVLTGGLARWRPVIGIFLSVVMLWWSVVRESPHLARQNQSSANGRTALEVWDGLAPGIQGQQRATPSEFAGSVEASGGEDAMPHTMRDAARPAWITIAMLEQGKELKTLQTSSDI